MKLHVVSFQVPFPPDYGGLIDVYYKLKALKEAGCSVVCIHIGMRWLSNLICLRWLMPSIIMNALQVGALCFFSSLYCLQ